MAYQELRIVFDPPLEESNPETTINLDDTVDDKGESCIYLITNTETKKQYVGQTTMLYPGGRKGGAQTRFKIHLYRAFNSEKEPQCTVLYNSMRKHGADKFTVETLLICSKKYIDLYEVVFIQLYNTISPKGYNIETGGCSIKVLHQDTRQLLSKARRFASVSDNDKGKILQAMASVGINDLPMGVQYSHDTKTGYEGFRVIKRGFQSKIFSAKGRTLEQKLQQAMKYYHMSSQEEIDEFNIQIRNEASLLIASKRIMDDNVKEAMKANDIDQMPIGIRYNKNKRMFYVGWKEKGKSTSKTFTRDTTAHSLRDALIFNAKRNGSPGSKESS